MRPISSSLKITVLLLAMVVTMAVYYGNLILHSGKDGYPAAKAGVLDLTGWDLQASGPVKLDGEWELYWNELFSSLTEERSAGYYPVPAPWKGQQTGASLTGKGAATYRLQIKLRPAESVYGLQISYIRMSSSVFVNGIKVGQSGIPALEGDSYTIENRPYTAYFAVQGDTAEIVIQAANHDFAEGGIVDSIYFGTAEAINRLENRAIGFELAVVVALLMLGIYHTGAFVWRRQERGYFYFGLYCIGAAVTFAFHGGKVFMQLFPFLHEDAYRIQTMSLHFSFIMLLLFTKRVCEGLISARLIKGLIVFFGTYCISVLFLPPLVFSILNYVLGTLACLAFITVTFLLSAAYFKGRYGSFSPRSLLVLIMALLCMVMGFVDSGLYMLKWVPDNNLGVISLLLHSLLISQMLAYRFSEAYDTIERMSQRLLDMDKLKDEFLASTSHEFQTPLNGIVNISEYMMEGGAGEVSATQKRNLSVIMTNARRLSVLVNDILDMELIKRNQIKLQPGPADVLVTVHVVWELLSFLVAGKNIRLVHRISDKLPLVRADENRLRQIMYNLLGNAIKFMDQGQITVTAEERDGFVHIAVEDEGIGIPRQRWEDIFQRYEQADRHISREYGGTGLGLFICRRLAELMGGTIGVEWSEPGMGTRIGFKLPVSQWHRQPAIPGKLADISSDNQNEDYYWQRPAAETAAAAEDEAPASSQNRLFTILAVDDEPSNLRVLSNLFQGENCRLLVASHGQEALDIVQSEGHAIDLMLLDVMMPRMSGLEVCRRLRREYTLFDLPIVMLTARSAPADIAAGFAAGANDFIAKPFESREVKARVFTLLQLRQSVKAALRAEMSFLQSQIKPHFLYNALNAIMSFCHTDSGKAAELISHLSSYLRRSFDFQSTDTLVTLHSELELLEAYLAIEQARFDDRLSVQFEVDETQLNGLLLPLTLQPIVENAIRHGILPKAEGGRVRITVRSDQDFLVVEVQDDGIGMKPEMIDKLLNSEEEGRIAGIRRGVGLPNIHRRLLLHYDEGLRINSSPGKGTTVSFRVPAGLVHKKRVPQATG